MSSNATRAKKRIQNELNKFYDDVIDDGLLVQVKNDFEWHVTVNGAIGTLYEGEVFILRIKFSPDYPIDAPQVTFMSPNIPVHGHIYSNGHICLNILGDDWSPALTVKSICLSIISMLSSATEKTRPPDDERYSRSKGTDSNPKNTSFAYHDDDV